MAKSNEQLKKYKFAVILIFLGILQGCYDSNSTNDIKVDKKAQASVIAEQATARNTYANCIATTPTNLKANIEAKYQTQCDQDYKKSWSKTIQGNE